ncbi:condensin complex protein MksE [Paralysiella testudinis]|uniref:Uncharacterized protein n=1 Tax=Paralysiella testudinis TaxID=2809020 RepID=A0A892ZD40_9NEIS|nr:hypothetical protein [Paralysiella testudinis]QRQ81235.1 hypothetical protein JQU52_10975 [Paralysiella testudinis]
MSNYFSDICHQLLSGNIIDQVRFPHLYDELTNEDFLNQVNDFLAKLQRRCTGTANGSGYYCVYTDARSPEVQAAVRRQFNEWAEKIEPLLMWLRLCRNVSENDHPIRSGEIIRHSELLVHIEQSERARSQLAEIIKLLERKSSEAKEQLNSLLGYLEKEHYLYPINNSGAVYRATAKWDLLYEQLAYIAACENISLAENPAEQEVLL